MRRRTPVTLLVSAAALLAACGSGAGGSRPLTSIPAVPTAASGAPSVAAAPSPSTASATSAATSTTAATSAAATPSPAAVPPYVPVRLATPESMSTYAPLEIDVDVQSLGAVSGVSVAASSAMGAVVNAAAARTLAAVKARDEKPTGTDPHNGITTSISLAEADDRYVTIRLTSSIYGSGAAHPNDTNAFFTFLRANGAPVALSDLAGSGGTAALYARLRTQTRMLLPVVTGPDNPVDNITMGTTPKALASAHIYPRADGLVVLFDPYAVASYAQGELYVVVPWAELSGVIADDTIPTSAAPAPKMHGGSSPGTVDGDVGQAVVVSKLPALAGVGMFTLVDPTYAQVDSTLYLLAQVVPDSDPAADVTVTFSKDELKAADGFTIVAAGHGSAGCAGVSAAVLTLTALAC